MGLRLLPMLVAVGMLAWAAGLLESTNLWDYLIDPWLAVGAIFQCLKVTGRQLLARFRMPPAGARPPVLWMRVWVAKSLSVHVLKMAAN
jgi:hypothetical protein